MYIYIFFKLDIQNKNFFFNFTLRDFNSLETNWFYVFLNKYSEISFINFGKLITIKESTKYTYIYLNIFVFSTFLRDTFSENNFIYVVEFDIKLFWSILHDISKAHQNHGEI